VLAVLLDASKSPPRARGRPYGCPNVSCMTTSRRPAIALPGPTRRAARCWARRHSAEHPKVPRGRPALSRGGRSALRPLPRADRPSPNGPRKTSGFALRSGAWTSSRPSSRASTKTMTACGPSATNCWRPSAAWPM
jgi:hypothetical protein